MPLNNKFIFSLKFQHFFLALFWTRIELFLAIVPHTSIDASVTSSFISQQAEYDMVVFQIPVVHDCFLMTSSDSLLRSYGGVIAVLRQPIKSQSSRCNHLLQSLTQVQNTKFFVICWFRLSGFFQVKARKYSFFHQILWPAVSSRDVQSKVLSRHYIGGQVERLL